MRRASARAYGFAALVLVLLTTVSPTWADEEARIVLVTNHADARIMPLLRAELESLGLTILVVDKGVNEILPDDLKRAARSRQAVAAFRVRVTAGEVEIWIADRVTGKVVLREVLTKSSDAKSEETEIVLRAVELLRVSLLELEAPHPSRGELPPPARLQRVVGFPEHRQRYSLGGGAGVLWFSSDLPLLPAARFGAGGRLSKSTALEITVASGLTQATVERTEGSVSASPRLGVIALRYAPPLGPWYPAIGAGAGLLWQHLLGQGEPPRASYEDDLYTGLALTDAALAYSLSPNFRVRVDATAGYAFRRAILGIDEQVAARTSHLLLLATLGVEATWP